MAELLNRLTMNLKCETDATGVSSLVSWGTVLVGESDRVVMRNFGGTLPFVNEMHHDCLKHGMQDFFTSMGRWVNDASETDLFALKTLTNEIASKFLVSAEHSYDLRIDGGLIQAFRKAGGMLYVPGEV